MPAGFRAPEPRGARAIALQDRPYARFLRANLTAKRGDPARALADYDRAIEAQPENLQLYRDRALARAALGRAEDALTDAERLVAGQPQWARSWLAAPAPGAGPWQPAHRRREAAFPVPAPTLFTFITKL